MRLYTLLILVLSLTSISQAQDFEGLRYENHIYDENIKSVQFYINGFLLDDPIISIEDQNPLKLVFDDLYDETTDFYYTIIHCDMDWKRSNLNVMEYIDGFTEERINDFEFSFKTLVAYTNYSFSIPNQNMRFTQTGNYLLVVYRKDAGDLIPVITRRFVVYDTKLLVEARLTRPTVVNKLRTHQEIDFQVFRDPKFKIRNPMQEIRAVVLQNGRWDKAITGIKPIFVRSQELVFDYQDKIVFEAGKEFRFVDLRSLRFRNFNTEEIIRRADGHDVILKTDLPRLSQAYLKINDANGKFTIENQDRGDAFLSADYADVFFTYKAASPFFDKDIYINGAFNDWKVDEEYRMVYNDRINAYVLKIPLKQGYYNYQYVLVPRDGDDPSPQTTETEGNWHESENDYNILIYYRPFGGRADQVIGHLKINSLD